MHTAEPTEMILQSRREQRETAQRLVQLAIHLPQADRALLESVYKHGTPTSVLARAAGRPARTIRERVHRLVKRVTSPAFGYVLRHCDEWRPLVRHIAEAVILHGRTHRETAEELGITVYRVRREVDRIRTIAEHH